MWSFSIAKPAMWGPVYTGSFWIFLLSFLTDFISCVFMVTDNADRRPSSGISNLGSHMPCLALFLYMVFNELRMATIWARISALVISLGCAVSPTISKILFNKRNRIIIKSPFCYTYFCVNVKMPDNENCFLICERRKLIMHQIGRRRTCVRRAMYGYELNYAHLLSYWALYW